jgi:hypothetical protein
MSPGHIVISLILLFLPLLARSFISSVVANTLIAPYLALVVTLIYYRLTAAHAAEPGTVPPGPGTDPPWPGTVPPGPGTAPPGPGTAPPA